MKGKEAVLGGQEGVWRRLQERSLKQGIPGAVVVVVAAAAAAVAVGSAAALRRGPARRRGMVVSGWRDAQPGNRRRMCQVLGGSRMWTPDGGTRAGRTPRRAGAAAAAAAVAADTGRQRVVSDGDRAIVKGEDMRVLGLRRRMLARWPEALVILLDIRQAVRVSMRYSP